MSFTTIILAIVYTIVGYAGASLTDSLGLRQRWGVLCIAAGATIGVAAPLAV